MIFYRSLPAIHAMTFDLDDTLYDNRPVIADLEQKMIVWLTHHHPVSASRPSSWWRELKLRLVQEQPLFKHDVTLWRFQQIKQGLVLLGYDDPKAEHAAQHTMNEVLRLRNQIDVPNETHRVLSLLAEKVPLIAITNGNADPNQIGLGEYFQEILKAGPDGLSKPFPDLFTKAQSRLRVPPQSILHIGDHLQSDVFGAWQSHFSSCWFNDQQNNLLHSTKASILPDIEVTDLAELLVLV